MGLQSAAADLMDNLSPVPYSLCVPVFLSMGILLFPPSLPPPTILGLSSLC